jgi:mannose-6-phosphate isomerase
VRMIERVTQQTLARDWGREVFVAETPQYLGKVLYMRRGTKGGLQYHVEKDETFFLWSGLAIVRSDDGTGQLIEEHMHPGEAYHIPPGAPHQVEAVTDCVFFEASTPHYDDRVRCEKDYGLPEGGGLPTTR